MSEAKAQFAQLRERYLESIFATIERAVRRANLEDTSLEAMLKYHLETGGKRLRAVLPLWVAEALGEDAANLTGFGAACELIHNATLIHDDLQDGDRMRRGQPTVWAEFGRAEAINLGDALLVLAPLCLEDVDVDEPLRWTVARQLFEQVLCVIDGQQREFSLRFSSTTWAEYEQMVAGKTSGLFALPMAGAARLCGADPSVVATLEEAASHLGVLFQIQDDVLDLYGQKGRARPGGDIREGKISALVVAFARRASDDEKARLRQILNADRRATGDEDVRWAIDVFRRRGALDAALEAIEQRRKKALDASEDSELQPLIEALASLFVAPIEDVLEN